MQVAAIELEYVKTSLERCLRVVCSAGSPRPSPITSPSSPTRSRKLPASSRSRHKPGDNPAKVGHRVFIRADAGGASQWLAEENVGRNLEFSFGLHTDQRVRDGVMGAGQLLASLHRRRPDPPRWRRSDQNTEV